MLNINELYFCFVFYFSLSKIINNGKRPICFSLRELASLQLGRLGLAFHFVAATSQYSSSRPVKV